MLFLVILIGVMIKNIYEKKYAKEFKGRIKKKGSSLSNCKLKYGTFGVKIMENGYATYNQLEAIRRLIVAQLARQGQIWLYCIPNVPKSLKPAGSRMGSGKGAVAFYLYKAQRGNLLLEFTCESSVRAQQLLKLIQSKLPFRIQGVVG